MTDTDLEKIRRRRRDRNRLGLRQWIVVFLTVCAGDQAGVAAHAWIIPVVGALISFLGVPAGLIGNELSIRYGLRTIATLVFLLSALAGGLLGFAAMLPYITVLGLSWYTLFARAICDGDNPRTTVALLVEPDCCQVLVDIMARAHLPAFDIAAIRHDAVAP